MNLYILLIETVILTIVFNLAIFIPLCKNPVWWIHDYPKDIQEEYYKTHNKIPYKELNKIALIKKFISLVVAIMIFVGLMVLAGVKTFSEGFLGSFFIWFVINAYDCFFMDWVLFANLKIVRLPGTEHMDKAYHQKKYHFIHGLIGILVGIIPCLIVGLIISVIC